MWFSKKILALFSVSLLAAGVAFAAVKGDLVLVSWGGAYQTSQHKAYVLPFIERNKGLNVLWDTASEEAVPKLRAMNEAGNVTWDLVDVTAADAIRLCDEALAIPIDFDNDVAKGADGSSATDDFGEYIISECFIPQIIYSTTFGYRKDLVSKPMTSVCDVFDLKTFPGKRGLANSPVNNMEWAALCSGVDKEDLYKVLATKEGVRQAFAKLDTIKDQIVWWSAGAQPPQFLADGEVVVSSAYNGRLFDAIIGEKQPIAMLWDHQIYDLDGWIIPKGTKNLEAVKEFVFFATDTQRLADQAKFISYSPARKSSVPFIGKHAEYGVDMLEHMPTYPANSKTSIFYDLQFWADNRDDLDVEWQAWLAR